MATAAILEDRKTAISQQRIDQSPLNLAWWRTLTLSTLSVTKLQIFENPRWRTAAILKVEKSQYLGNGLSNRHDLAQWRIL